MSTEYPPAADIDALDRTLYLALVITTIWAALPLQVLGTHSRRNRK